MPDDRRTTGRVGTSRRRLFLVLVASVLFLTVFEVSRSAFDAHAAPAATGDTVSGRSAPGNGQLPRSSLRPVGGVWLAPDAADAFQRMQTAAARDGAVLAVTDGYRSYERQVELKQRKGWLAARPGTSQHGWGVAVDFDTRVTDFAWLRRHAGTYGWIHPAWARPGGSKPELWHWEYVGGRGPEPATDGSGPSAPPTLRFEEGDVVATARFEPVHGPAGAWFVVREGLGQLAAGPGHYPGTAGPGEAGNFAVAGYRRDHGAPFHGLDRLWPGDQIRVRAPTGEQHLYRVFDGDDLGADDGWAVGDDPRGTGTTHVMTVTTGTPDGGLRVVWAHLP